MLVLSSESSESVEDDASLEILRLFRGRWVNIVVTLLGPFRHIHADFVELNLSEIIPQVNESLNSLAVYDSDSVIVHPKESVCYLD